MSKLGKLSIDGQLSVLPVRKKPGGQLKPRGALARARYDQKDARFFGVDHLEHLLMDSPACPLKWNVTKEFELKKRGGTTKEHIPGVIQTWIENGGRYEWKIKYSQGVTELLDVEALAGHCA